MDPPIWPCVVMPWTLPVGTYSNPSPIDGPTGPIGAFTLNSHSFSPVCLSNAKITPDLTFSVNGI